MGPEPGDAFGEALLDALAGGTGLHVIERDDGFVDVMDASMYFSTPETWPDLDHRALELVAGRVLDVGAGAGRHSLVLQDRGSQPVALDTSPGAVRVCRERGVAELFPGTVQALAALEPEPFDAALLLGNNLGLLESRKQAPLVLDALRRLLRPGGLVVGTGLDPHLTDDPVHLAYHRRNTELGRLPGQVRMRVRRRRIASAWFDYVHLAPDELARLASESGWRLEHTEPDPRYVAILRPG
jgi:SAM-dependent methyltransferase